MQAVFIAHHEFGAQHIFGNGVVAGQQRQHGGGVGFQQMFSFLVQQQLAQTVQHCGRLLVGHRHRDQQETGCSSRVKALAARLTATALRKLPSALSFSQTP